MIRLHHLAWLVLAAVLVLVPAALLAQAVPPSPPPPAPTPTTGALSGLFGTPAGDPYSSVMLNQLFGPLFPSAVGGGTTGTVFSNIIGFFNVIVLVVGGLLFFWNVTVGLLQSAHEGEILGRRWSSLWAPLRVIFAIGLVVPLPNLGGYNVAQAGVAYLVKGSTNIASAVWTTSARTLLVGDVPIAAPAVRFEPAALRDLYLNAACLRLVNHQVGIADRTGAYSAAYVPNVPPGPMDPTEMVTPYDGLVTADDVEDAMRSARNGIEYVTVLKDGTVAKQPKICGSWRTPDLPAYVARVIAEANPAGRAEAAVVKGIFETGHKDILVYVSGEMNALVARHWNAVFSGDPNLPDISGEIVKIAEEANRRLLEHLTKVRDAAMGAAAAGGGARPSARDILLDRITGGASCVGAGAVRGGCYGEGWIGAGSWYMLMARLNNEVTSLLTAAPHVDAEHAVDREAIYEGVGGRGRGWFGGIRSEDLAGMVVDEEANRIAKRYERMFDESALRLAALGFEMPTSQLVAATEMGAEGFWEKIPGLQANLAWASRGIIGFLDPGSWADDPMIGLMDIGHTLIHLASGIMAVAVVGGFFAGAGAAVAVLPIFSVLVAAGVTLAYILPMMPFLYWILGVTGYFLLVFEAVVAVNLWALAHMRLDGEGISGEAGRQGWLMLLALTFTPVLMVVGLLVGMAIFRVTSDLISIGLFPAVTAIAGGSPVVWLFGTVAYACMIVLAYGLLLERSFSLIAEFPNRVMRWMGAQVDISGGEGRIQAAAGGAALAANQFGQALEGVARKGPAANKFLRDLRQKNKVEK